MPHAMHIRQTGGPEVLKWAAVEVAEPGSGQVPLRQTAAASTTSTFIRRTGDLEARATSGSTVLTI